MFQLYKLFQPLTLATTMSQGNYFSGKKNISKSVKKSKLRLLKKKVMPCSKKETICKLFYFIKKPLIVIQIPFFLSNLGFAHQRLENQDEAIKEFDQALAMESLTAAIRKKCGHRKLTSLVALEKTEEAQQFAAQLQEDGILTEAEILNLLK